MLKRKCLVDLDNLFKLEEVKVVDLRTPLEVLEEALVVKMGKLSELVEPKQDAVVKTAGVDQNSESRQKRVQKMPKKLEVYVIGKGGKRTPTGGDEREEASGICPKCNVYVTQQEHGIVCESCNAYWHYHCAGVTQEEVDNLENEEFLCEKHSVTKEVGVSVLPERKSSESDYIRKATEDVICQFRIHSYSLNGKKAIKKKLKNLDTRYVISMKESGKQYTINLNSVTYQIIKEKLAEFGEQLNINIKRPVFDDTGKNVENQYVVALSGGLTEVAVTCYHTTNLILLQLRGRKNEKGWDSKLADMAMFVKGTMEPLINMIQGLPQYDVVRKEFMEKLLAAQESLSTGNEEELDTAGKLDSKIETPIFSGCGGDQSLIVAGESGGKFETCNISELVALDINSKLASCPHYDENLASVISVDNTTAQVGNLEEIRVERSDVYLNNGAAMRVNDTQVHLLPNRPESMTGSEVGTLLDVQTVKNESQSDTAIAEEAVPQCEQNMSNVEVVLPTSQTIQTQNPQPNNNDNVSLEQVSKLALHKGNSIMAAQSFLNQKFFDDDTITLGVQFQNKKFLVSLGNILKGKGSKEEALYGMILKLKEKIGVLEAEKQETVVSKVEALKIQEAVQQVQEKDGKLEQMKAKVKKLTEDNKELKKERVQMTAERKKLMDEMSVKEKTIKSKENSIITLHEKVALLSASEVRLQARIELLESTNQIIDGSVDLVNESQISSKIDDMSEIQRLKSKLEEKEQCIATKEKRINDINNELVQTSDVLAEREEYIRNVDSMYAEIINRKDGSISGLLQIVDADDEMNKRFKRMLVKVLAEKEFNNIKEMYMSMSHKNASTQVDEKITRAGSIEIGVNTNTEELCNRKEGQNKHVATAGNDSGNLDIVEVVQNNPALLTPSQAKDKEELVTIRIINLPPDIDEHNIRRLFGLCLTSKDDDKFHSVKVERTSVNKVDVKIILPQSLEQEILKFHLKTIHQRVIKVFKIEKCRLGDSCVRKVCRFGHEKRYCGEGNIQSVQTAGYGVINIHRQEAPLSTGQHSCDERNGEIYCGSTFMDRGDQCNAQDGESCCVEILGLPQNTLREGVPRIIKMYAGMDNSEANQMKVRWAREYHGAHGEPRTEACVVMSQVLGVKTLKITGNKVDGFPIEVRRVMVCKYHGKVGGCTNLNRQFFHPEATENNRNQNQSRNVHSNRPCWFEFEARCPFGKNCKFQHRNKEMCDVGHCASGSKNDMNRMVSGIGKYWGR